MCGQTAFDKLVRLAALCRNGEADISEFEGTQGTELSGVEEGEDGMSDEEGDGVEGEGEMTPPDWRVRAGGKRQRTHPSLRHIAKNEGAS